MDLFLRFVGILMLFVMYIAVGVKGVAFGAGCKGTGVGDCTDNNTICDTGSNKCACSATYYRKNATTCAKRVAFDAACTGSGIGDCSDSNTVCDATSHKCACSTTSYKANATTCATKMALNGACTATPTGQCADPQAECSATKHTCVCKSTHFVNKAGACHQKVAINATCVVAEPAKDQCVSNTECQKAGGKGPTKCLCKATHYESVGSCKPRKSPKVNCLLGECVTHASCDSGTNKCVCDAGYDPSPTIIPTMCNGVVKVLTLAYMYVVPIFVSLKFLLP